MGYCSAVAGVLALAVLASASVGDNSLDSGERVVLVSPVLAPPQDSKVHSSVRARQFPILVLLAQRNTENSREQQAKSLERNPQPVYVQKLEDQEQPAPTARQLNRQRRHLFSKHFGISYGGGGGGGGCNTCGGGYQQPVYQQPVYQQPVYYHPQPVYQQQPQTIYLPQKRKPKHKYGGHGGGYGGGHGGYSPCGGSRCGGGGGNYGGGQSSASVTVTANANSQSSSYKK